MFTPRSRAFSSNFILAALLLMLLPSASFANAQADPVDKLVENIIAIRGEVDDLENELKGLKTDHQSRMSALAREEGQLLAERERQHLKLKKVAQLLEKQRDDEVLSAVGDEELRPVVVAVLDLARAYVKSSLPFKRQDRIAALDEMQAQLEGQVLEPSRVANQAWSFIADEIRLTGELGLFRQPIRIDGQERLADVARVGMMHLYFRTDDNRVGLWSLSAEGGGFNYVSGSNRDQVLELMDSLRKNVRTGYFVLPNPGHAAEPNL